MRAIYIPGLLQLLSEQGVNPYMTWETDPNPEDVPLWLPSSLEKERRRAACAEGLPEMELRLRTAQCSGALDGIRHVLRMKTRMVYFKNKNIRGQREGTRSRAVIDRVHKRAFRLVEKYRAARRAKLELEGPGNWENTYRELHNRDVRSYSTRERKKKRDRQGIWEDGHAPEPRATDDVAGISSGDSDSDESDVDADMEEDGTRLTQHQIRRLRKKGTGETRKNLSWIWLTTPVQTDDADQP